MDTSRQVDKEEENIDFPPIKVTPQIIPSVSHVPYLFSSALVGLSSASALPRVAGEKKEPSESREATGSEAKKLKECVKEHQAQKKERQRFASRFLMVGLRRYKVLS